MVNEYPRALYHKTAEPVRAVDPAMHARYAKDGYGTWDEVFGPGADQSSEPPAAAAPDAPEPVACIEPVDSDVVEYGPDHGIPPDPPVVAPKKRGRPAKPKA